MRTLIAAAAMIAGLHTANAQDHGGLFDFGPPPADYVGGLGNVTSFGPTGLFQNPTSGIVRKNAILLQDCLGFNESGGDNFITNGLLLTYGVTDWMEIGGFFAAAAGLNAAVLGDSDFYGGQIHSRIRLVRDEGGMPEITIGGLFGFGDDLVSKDSVMLMASKGFTLSDGEVLRSARIHAGVRQVWPEFGEDFATAFVGLEVEVLRNIYLVGDVNTDNSNFVHRPWSAGVQYRNNGFGLSLAVVQDPDRTDETLFVGIGISY